MLSLLHATYNGVQSVKGPNHLAVLSQLHATYNGVQSVKGRWDTQLKCDNLSWEVGCQIDINFVLKLFASYSFHLNAIAVLVICFLIICWKKYLENTHKLNRLNVPNYT